MAPTAVLSQALSRRGISSFFAALISNGNGRSWGGLALNKRSWILIAVLLNWKSLPFAWTFRVLHAFIRHLTIRKAHTYEPAALFHPVTTSTHVGLLEIDYNLHKSNSTYFADLDVSRSHLVTHLFARGLKALRRNARTKLVMDPRTEEPAKGALSVSLGAVHCSFRREIRPFQRYELWSRILSWDRKWMYIVTYFMEKGAASDAKKQNTAWEKKIYAAAVSKYVFKIGRLTVHPAVLMDANQLLPERPGGWAQAQDSSASTNFVEPGVETDNGTTWNWRRTEVERLKGMEYAEKFAAMDGLSDVFDVGEQRVLGSFWLG